MNKHNPESTLRPGRDYPLRMVADWLRLVRERPPPGRAFTGIVQTFRSRYALLPTPEELRNMVFQVVVSGAAGVYDYSFGTRNAIRASL